MVVESTCLQYQPGEEIVPGYTLVKLLGRGMEGEVWRARAAGGTQVAVKIVRSLSRVGGRKQLKALRTLRDIRHTNLCPLHCFWTKDGEGHLLEDGEFDVSASDSGSEDSNGPASFYQTMQIQHHEPKHSTSKTNSGSEAEQLILVMGLGDCTLFDRLEQVRSKAGLLKADKDSWKVAYGLQPSEVIHYLRGTADAIDTLNKNHDLYHCDIKPQNILVVGGGAMVCDFGLASKIQGDLTKTQTVMFATLAYAAPEVLRKKYSTSVDQYSLATTYFELRTGLLPFDITTEADVTLAKCTGKLDFGQVTKAERKVLQKAMQVEPELRYNSCTDFIKAIARATGVDAKPVSSRLAVAVACLLIPLVGAAVYYLRHDGNDGEAKRRIKDSETQLAKFAPFNPAMTEETYEHQLEPLRYSLENSTLALELATNEGLRQQSRQLMGKALRQFDTAIALQISAGQRSSEIYKAIGDDLKLLDGFCLNNATLEGVDLLKSHVQLEQLQLALLDKQKVSQELIGSVRQSVKNDPQVLSAVALALAHGVWAAKQAEVESLKDIAKAKLLIDEQKIDSLPQWCADQWQTMQSAMSSQLELALGDPKTKDEIKAIIKDGWPDIVDLAKLAKWQKLISDKKFNDFLSVDPTEFAAIAKPLKINAENPHKNEAEVFALMQRGVASPAAANAMFIEIEKKLSDKTLRRSFIAAIPPWVEEVARRYGATDATLAKAEPTYQSGMKLMKLIELGGDVPASLTSMLLAAAIKQGPPWDSPILDSALKPSSNGPSNRNLLLSSAIKLERDALASSPKQLGANGIGNMESLLRQATETLDSVPSLPLKYADYLRGLTAWHLQNSPEVALHNSPEVVWKQLQSDKDAEKIRLQLGPVRCGWIAATVIDQLTEDSSVKDNEVLSRRFIVAGVQQDVAGRLELAKWWLQTADPNSEIRHRLSIQRLLFALAKTDASQSQKLLNDLTNRLGPTCGQGKAEYQYGQLYRAAFECSLAQKQQALTLRYAVACLDVGLGDRIIDNPLWVKEFLEPTMRILRPIDGPDNSKKNFDLKTLDPQTLIRFCNFYLRTDASNVARRNAFDTDPRVATQEESNWVDNLEISARLLAAVSTERTEKLDGWLKTFDFSLRRKDLLGMQVDPSLLDRLEEYVSSATAIGIVDPRLSLSQAYVEFYRALDEKNVGKRREMLGNAEKSYLKAIDLLKPLDSERERVALYKAYCGHSISLVALAFEQLAKSKEKKVFLEKAYASATEATTMIANFDENVFVDRHVAHMAVGNSCEDLAYYCGLPPNSSVQQNYFKKAIDAFQLAVDKTSLGKSMHPHYSLARCQFRYWENCLSGDNYLKSVRDEMGQYDETAAPGIRAEWLGWRAKINSVLKQPVEALKDGRKAYDIVRKDRDLFLDSHQCDQITLLFASLLADTDNQQQREEAVALLDELVKTCGSATYWNAIEALCRVLVRLRREGDMVHTIESIPQEKIDDGIKIDPIGTMKTLISLSDVVLSLRLNLDTNVAPKLAASCLKNLGAKAMRAPEFQAAKGRHRAIQFCSTLMAANNESYSSASVEQKLRAYLDLLPADNPPEIDLPVLFLGRKAMLFQLLAEFDLNKSEFLNKISSLPPQDRQKVKDQIRLIQELIKDSKFKLAADLVRFIDALNKLVQI